MGGGEGFWGCCVLFSCRQVPRHSCRRAPHGECVFDICYSSESLHFESIDCSGGRNQFEFNKLRLSVEVGESVYLNCTILNTEGEMAVNIST